VACLQPRTLPFVLDGRAWEGVGAVLVAVYGGESGREWWEGVGWSRRSGGGVVDGGDGGGGEVAVTCHGVMMMGGGYADSG
jgi:hypothetical protein